MIQARDYQVQINADEAGVIIEVRHKITGMAKQARPGATESVGAVTDRLITQITAEIYDAKEFEFSVGHTRSEGAARDSLSVTHKPTGVSRAKYCSEGASHQDLLDEVLTELWRRKMDIANS